MYAVTEGLEGFMQTSTHICQVVGMPISGPMVTICVPSEWSGLAESSQGGEDLKPKLEVPICPKTKATGVKK